MIRKKRNAGGQILLTGLLITSLGLSGCGKESVIYEISDSESVQPGSAEESSSAGSSDDGDEGRNAVTSGPVGSGTDESGTDGSGGTADAGSGSPDGADAGDGGGNTVTSVSAGAGGTGEGTDEAPANDEGPLYVYVCGAVAKPGVYELPRGSRVYQAVEAAGGLTQEADGRCLNQAEPLEDGRQITVYTREEAEKFGLSDPGNLTQHDTAGSASQDAGSSSQSMDSGAQEAASKVNLNTATKEELMTLPGIGESRADAIIEYRQTAGGFSSIEDIQNISGIKEKAFAKIKDYIEV